MHRTSLFGLAAVLGVGALSCAPKDEKYGPPETADTGTLVGGGASTTTPSDCGGGGAGGAGGVTCTMTTAGGTAGSAGGTTTTTGGAGGGTCTYDGGTGGTVDPGTLCEEPDPLPPLGSYGPIPSDCDCRLEAYQLLSILANDAKLRHDVTGDSCGSALPVPAQPPGATYYVPYTMIGTGMDFDTGNADVGWLCLGFVPPKRIHCRYSYTKGIAPKTEEFCGPEAGVTDPQSFEIVAEGDKDGDGNYATFVIVGDYNLNAGGVIKLRPIQEYNWDE